MSKSLWIAGNWKSNGDKSLCQEFTQAFNDTELVSEVQVVVCPPATYLQQCVNVLTQAQLSVGAQNLSDHPSGAYTGEITGGMLKDVGVEYVIIGHSERREIFNEDNAVLAEKIKQALDAGLKPIFCIGEPLEIRADNLHEDYIAKQIDQVIALVGIESFDDALVAYEPIWAIGTGKTANNDQIDAMHSHIRDTFSKHSDTIASRLPILYGGSVKPDNAVGILSLSNVDGALIGGASLKVDDFMQIISDAASL